MVYMKASLNIHFTVKDFIFYFSCQRTQRNGQKLQTDSTHCGMFQIVWRKRLQTCRNKESGKFMIVLVLFNKHIQYRVVRCCKFESRLYYGGWWLYLSGVRWMIHEVLNFLKSHTVNSPTDTHILKLWLKFTLKLCGSYMFRSTTIIRELAIEPG